MIVYEPYNETLTRAYSDAGMCIERDGNLYDEAIDPTSAGRTYTETDIPIHVPEPPVEDPDVTEEDLVAALSELGVDMEG